MAQLRLPLTPAGKRVGTAKGSIVDGSAAAPGADIDRLYQTPDWEDDRLSRTPHGRLELLRTQEIIRRYLPTAPAPVLDVGGGTGAHARWLAADGYQVHLIDPVAGHVARAAALANVTAEVGDARELKIADHSMAVVLLLGPLYHLTEAADRARALAEARRVLIPGGLLVAAATSRCITLLEAGSSGLLEPELMDRMARTLSTGAYDGHLGFVPAYFHTAEELRDELSAARLSGVEVYGVEGPAWPALDAVGIGGFAALAGSALRGARLVERNPLLINASAHFLGVGHTDVPGVGHTDVPGVGHTDVPGVGHTDVPSSGRQTGESA
jgi:ubiquinone/menaquinone biosynthesis C-methylase UbiE